MKSIWFAISTMVAALLVGCGDIRTFWDPHHSNIDTAQKVPSSSGSAAFDIPRLIVEPIKGADIHELDVSRAISASSYEAAVEGTSQLDRKTEEKNAVEAYRLSVAFKIFDEHYIDQKTWPEAQLRRRQIQDTIIAESNSLCGEYEQALNRFNQEGNFLFGSASTVLGGLGALFTDVTAARSLAGAASITSGVRSELNSDVFQQQAIQVITNGINSRRKRIAQIMACHVNDSLQNYTLERAVAQAFKYHEACSLIEGLEEANKATSQGSDVGLAAAHQTMHAIELMYQDLHPNSAQVFSTTPLSPSGVVSPSTVVAVSQPISASQETTCNTLLALEDSAEGVGASKTSTATPLASPSISDSRP